MHESHTINGTINGLLAKILLIQENAAKHCFKVEFWLTLARAPFFFRGPVVGSLHDASISKNTGDHKTFLFDHHKNEMFLADLGYIGCDHCLVPYKSSRKKKVSNAEHKVNQRVSLIRSRIERSFSHFDKYRFFWGTDHDLSWLKDALQIVLVVVYGLLADEPQYDLDTTINSALRTIDCAKECWCSKGCGVVENVSSRRDHLKDNIEYVPYNPKESKNRKKAYSFLFLIRILNRTS